MEIANLTTQKILVNRRNLFVELYGQAQNPAVIFLHQGLGSTYSWQAQTRFFANAGYYVVAYDRWGYGKSDPRNSLITADFAEDLADLVGLLEELKINRVALVGHSDGGTLALYFSARFPEKTACLITVAAHIYIEISKKPAIVQVRQAFYENIWFREALNRLHGEKTSQVFSNWYDGWLNIGNLDWDMRHIIRQISCPTLVVQGDDDEHGSPQQAKDIARAIPGAQLWMPPDGGHLFPQDHPEIFNPQVLSFLSEHYVQ